MEASETVYHVFSNVWDEWEADYEKAEKIFEQMKAKHGTARLYEEVYADRENDNMISESCLLSYGPYPL